MRTRSLIDQKNRSEDLTSHCDHSAGNAALVYSRNYSSTVQYMKYLKPRGVLKKPLTLESIM